MTIYDKIRKDFPDKEERDKFLKGEYGKWYVSILLTNEMNKAMNRFGGKLENYLKKFEGKLEKYKGLRD